MFPYPEVSHLFSHMFPTCFPHFTAQQLPPFRCGSWNRQGPADDKGGQDGGGRLPRQVLCPAEGVEGHASADVNVSRVNMSHS